MIKITNKKAKYYVTNQVSFKGNNTFGEVLNENLYVVYSYSKNWILYLHDGFDWYGCNEKYSATTSKHSSQLRPDVISIQYKTQQELQNIKYFNL
jgi:hypothetical protein